MNVDEKYEILSVSATQCGSAAYALVLNGESSQVHCIQMDETISILSGALPNDAVRMSVGVDHFLVHSST